MRTHRLCILIAICLWAFSSVGCSLLIGNVKPVEEKSESYQILDLSKENPDWVKLDSSAAARPKDSGEKDTSTETSDISFQSQKTASIISLNSACRIATPPSQDLHAITKELLLGFSDITQHTEKEVPVSGVPALETTLQGKLNGETMMLRTVVLQQRHCVYDLMYIARPENFVTQAEDFSRFTGSLRLK